MKTLTLRYYRYHSRQCDKGYTSLDYNFVQDCSCGLAITGYLRNHLDDGGKPKRILHKPLGTNDVAEAKVQVTQFSAWGSLTASGVGVEALKGKNVRVADAIKFFFECGAADSSRSANVIAKYKLLLEKRLLPWCNVKDIELIRAFDEPITVRSFFNSWRSQSETLGLGVRTKARMIERLRTFLTFCIDNEWLTKNHAKKIKVVEADVEPKFAWNKDEFEHIVNTFDAG